jgi:hypothetical protein
VHWLRGGGGLIFMRWTHIDLGAQGINGIQRPKLFFQITRSKAVDEYYNSYRKKISPIPTLKYTNDPRRVNISSTYP